MPHTAKAKQMPTVQFMRADTPGIDRGSLEGGPTDGQRAKPVGPALVAVHEARAPPARA
jgi:hypothetical protein